MVCGACGGFETYVQDGVEYCKECNIQFKGSQSEESSDESFSKSLLISAPSVKKKAKDKRIHYQPWISTEAYNLIIAKQVSELIKLGCSEKLKNVVFYIWAQYLQKCEIAFKKLSNSVDDKPHLSAFAVQRDVKLLYGDGRAERRWKKSKRSSKSKELNTVEKNEMKLIKEEDEDSEVVANPSSTDEDLHISLDSFNSAEHQDDSSSGLSTDERESSDSSTDGVNIQKKKVYSSEAKKYVARNKVNENKRSDVHHMTLSKTLSFCHLGLLYTEDQLSLFDLIRLINEDHVPYIDVTRYFPSTMQLQDGDHSCYTKYATPKLRTISLTSAKLWKFLRLPKFKHPSLLPIAIRFVKDLNLPNDIIPALRIITEDFESKTSQGFSTTEKAKQNLIPLYEVQAMAAIVVVLKMLLVLDGNFEVEHDEVMIKLNAIAEDSKFFIWNEWKQQAEMKEYLFLRNGFNYEEMSRLDSLCIDRIVENYPYCCTKKEQNSNLSKATKREYSARSTLRNVLEKLTTVSPLKKKPTSFPLRYELQRFMSEWQRIPIYKDTKDIDFSFISRDFSNDKFCYKHFDGSTNSDDLVNVLFSSLYESVKLTHVFYRGFCSENIIRTSKKYWHLNILHKTLAVDNKRSAGRKGKWLEKLPCSFKWLLIFLSKYLQISYSDLYLEIKNIEQKLFK